MMAHSMPQPGGRLPQPQLLASSSRQYDEMIKADESNQIMFIDRYLEEGIKLDYWWMDAGWHHHDGVARRHVGSRRLPAVCGHLDRPCQRSSDPGSSPVVTGRGWPTNIGNGSWAARL
jgi:hypothetical protein